LLQVQNPKRFPADKLEFSITGVAFCASPADGRSDRADEIFGYGI